MSKGFCFDSGHSRLLPHYYVRKTPQEGYNFVSIMEI